MQLHQARLLFWFAQQFYDYGNPSYADVRSRLSEAISRGIPASKLGVGFALTSPVANGAWSQAAPLSAMQSARAEYGVRRGVSVDRTGAVEQNGQANQWISNAAGALA